MEVEYVTCKYCTNRKRDWCVRHTNIIDYKRGHTFPKACEDFHEI